MNYDELYQKLRRFFLLPYESLEDVPEDWTEDFKQIIAEAAAEIVFTKPPEDS